MLKVWPFLILSIMILIPSKNASSTKPPDNVPPNEHCECTYSDRNCDCSCRNLGKSNTLPPLPRDVTSCPYFAFEMEDGNFDSVPPNLFSSVGTVNTFFFDSVDINFKHYLPEERDLSPFRGVTFLQEAYVVLLKVKVTGTWNWYSLSELRPGSGARASVQIMRTDLPVLTSDFSEVCAGSVTTVRMNQCGIKLLGHRVFASHKNLTDVNLSKNIIHEIKRSHFPKPALKLKQIVLSKNWLSTIPECMFSDMPALETVDLTGNPISTLDEDTFSPYFSQVLFIGIQDFRLNCDCHIRWLKNESIVRGKNSMEAATCKSSNNMVLRKLSELSVDDLLC